MISVGYQDQRASDAAAVRAGTAGSGVEMAVYSRADGTWPVMIAVFGSKVEPQVQVDIYISPDQLRDIQAHQHLGNPADPE